MPNTSGFTAFIECIRAGDESADRARASLGTLPDGSNPAWGQTNVLAGSRRWPVVPDYEILEELGRGAMGVVYKARQTKLQRVVALKLIPTGVQADAEELARFRTEARAAAAVQHPQIVAIYEAGQAHGQPYLALQYVAGPSLAEVLRSQALPPEQAARLVSAIARAVEHLHAQGIVHRDLKPSNILLDESGRPHVSDFGLVKVLRDASHQTSTGAIVGTPSYMAPEQAAGRVADVGPLSDVYSLGALLYAALTGRAPFEGKTVLHTLLHVQETEPIPPRQTDPRIPQALELICLRCLAKAPAGRYPSAVALAQDLDRFLRGEEIETRQPCLARRLGRWVRREPALATRLGCLVTCAAILEVNFWVFRSVAPAVHLAYMPIFPLWAAASLFFHPPRRTTGGPGWQHFAWVATDLVFYTVLMKLSQGPASPLMGVYLLLVAGSGLWSHVSLTWFATAIAEAAYAFLVVDAWLRSALPASGHRYLMFLFALAVQGFVVAYQVKRFAKLRQYCEQTTQPGAGSAITPARKPVQVSCADQRV